MERDYEFTDWNFLASFIDKFLEGNDQPSQLKIDQQEKPSMRRS